MAFRLQAVSKLLGESNITISIRVKRALHRTGNLARGDVYVVVVFALPNTPNRGTKQPLGDPRSDTNFKEASV
jgi:hypothetical protein